MNTKGILGCVVLAHSIGASRPAFGKEDGMFTGNELLKSCTAAIRMIESTDTPTPETLYDSGLCLGFVDGVAGGIEWTSKFYEEAVKARRIVCIPDSVTKGQKIRVVIKALNDDPANLHIEAGVLVFTAFVKNFPCKTEPSGGEKPK